MPYDNARVIEVFRKGPAATPEDWRSTGTPVPAHELLILHTVGAVSGLERVTPLRYRPDRGRYAVFASNSGASQDPAWFRNLMAHPTTVIEVEADLVVVEATVATGDERQRIWADLIAIYPHFAHYEERAGREIPVVLLSPTGNTLGHPRGQLNA
jgi:deazaflavin-dependent oxidoreductase (nitroreductase family)